MSLSSAEKYLIQDALEDFLSELRSSSVPLQEDVTDLFDEANLRKALRLKRRRILTEFIRQNPDLSREKLRVILKEINAELKEAIESYVEKSDRHWKQSQSFLEKLEDYLCEGLRTWSEVKLAESPYIDLESLEAFLEDAKSVISNNFMSYWKPGNADFHLKRKSELEGKMDALQKDILEKQREYLDGPVTEEKKLFGELEKELFEKLEKLKSYLSSLKLEWVPKFLLERQIGEIEEFVDGKGVFQRKEYRRIHKEVLEKLAEVKAKTVLCKMEEKQNLEGSAVSVVMELDVELRQCFNAPEPEPATAKMMELEPVSPEELNEFEVKEVQSNRNVVTTTVGTRGEEPEGTRKTKSKDFEGQRTGEVQMQIVQDSTETNEMDVMECNIVLRKKDGEGKRQRLVEKDGFPAVDLESETSSKRLRFDFDINETPNSSLESLLDSSTSTPTTTPKAERSSRSSLESLLNSSASTPTATPKARRSSRRDSDGREEHPRKALTMTPTQPKEKTSPPSMEITKKTNRNGIFRNMEFFLTEAQVGAEPDDVNWSQATPSRYDMDVLRKEIEVRGGRVLDRIGEELGRKVFCISDGYCRTVKYLYSLAKGIPCVCNRWIRLCLALNEVVSYAAFSLQAGWSVEQQDVVPQHYMKPLKGYRIQFLTSAESDKFLIYWKQFLVACEAQLPSSSRKKGQLIPNGTQVVVVGYHSKATKQLMEEASSKKIPVVNPEWILQAIIVGERSEMFDYEGFKVAVEGEKESEEIRETTADSVVISVAVNEKLNYRRISKSEGSKYGRRPYGRSLRDWRSRFRKSYP